MTAWSTVHVGPPPTSTGNAALAETPEGVVLVTPWGWRGEGLASWTLTERGFADPKPLGSSRTYYAPAAWVDGARVAVATFQGELRIRTGDEDRTMAIAADDGPMSALAVGERLLVAIGKTSWSLVVGREPRSLGAVEVGTHLARGNEGVIAASATAVAKLDGDAWKRLATPPQQMVSTPAWDPSRERFVVLAGQGPTTLYALDGGSWKAVGPPFPQALGNTVLLAWDARRKALIAHGGNDARFSMQARRVSTWVLDPSGWRELRAPWTHRPGRTDSIHRVGDRTLLVSHTHFEAERIGAEGLTPAFAAPDEGTGPLAHHDDRYTFLAGSSEGLWALDRRGHVWLEPGTGWTQRSREQKSPVADRVDGTLVAEESGGRSRLLLVGGYRRNDTWAWDGESWKLLAPSGLPAGPCGVVGTPSGVFALAGTELRRLVGDAWERCFAIEDWSSAKYDGRTLHYDSRRDVLVAVTGSFQGSAVRAFSKDGARLIGGLPDAQSRSLGDGATVGLDPEGDRLLMLAENSVEAFSLSALGDARGVPSSKGGKVTPTAKKRVPKGAFRRASLLVATKKRVAKPKGVVLPKHHSLYAWLPASDLLTLGEHASLAVSVHDDVFERDVSDPFGDAMKVQLLDTTPPVPILIGRDGPVAVEGTPFDDPDPLLLDELDATPAWDLRGRTKVGGFADGLHASGEDHRAMQKHARCRTCKKALRYAVQLSYDFFDIGDSGRIFVYVCPSGCDAAATLESL